MLDFLFANRSLFEERDLLMDRRIAHVKMSDAYPVLRHLYYNNRAARKKYHNINMTAKLRSHIDLWLR